MGKGIGGVVLRAFGAKEHTITVTGREQRTDNLVRIHFHSDTLLNPSGEEPGNWMRAWFPGADGDSKEYQRGYTYVNVDAPAGNFSVDFVIHEPAGPACAWAQRCEIGETIDAHRLGEDPFHPEAEIEGAGLPTGFLFLGDLASYPAIHQMALAAAEERPDATIEVILERHSDDDEQSPLPEGENITARWVDPRPDGTSLYQEITGRDWTGWYIWAAAETLVTKHVRTFLRKEAGLPKKATHTQAYWVKGKNMGTDRG
ncbi:siderophore-interacting protein [Corynebacterium terpenotabidum]|uniref:Transmembrane ABC transporter ATP-binding protein n=1 Tax=Corynebacterium terpenotabidum Y-11 TaxID=1200352 RepID=S4XF87_9CORY|nr:siderophore-interacting protein [Corynebacterium terpenotabidum]AGP31797.1 transmembrane ABC transporter ATP-binding protein [Corynebacterium terpenotabidum Y-11]